MKKFNASEWNIADVLTQPQEIFVLWVVADNLCHTTKEFRESYGEEFPLSTLLDSLESQGFIKVEADKIQLTNLGYRAVDFLKPDSARLCVLVPIIVGVAVFALLVWSKDSLADDTRDLCLLASVLASTASIWYLCVRETPLAFPGAFRGWIRTMLLGTLGFAFWDYFTAPLPSTVSLAQCCYVGAGLFLLLASGFITHLSVKRHAFALRNGLRWLARGVYGAGLGFAAWILITRPDYNQFEEGALIYLAVSGLVALAWKLSAGEKRQNFVTGTEKALTFIDKNWILYFVPVLIGCFGVHFAYLFNGDYWITTWAEYGYWGETALLLFVAIITVWTRCILFSQDRNTNYVYSLSTDKTITGDTQTQKGEPPRWTEMFLYGFGLMFTFWVIYLYMTISDYRQSPTRWYYPTFYMMASLYFAWNFEVLSAVFRFYTSGNLKTVITTCHQLDDLAERLREDTTDLIWSMGTVIFFVVVYFNNYYLTITNIITIVCCFLIVLVATWPWYEANKRASELIETEVQSLRGKVKLARENRYKKEIWETSDWLVTVVKPYEDLQKELDCYIETGAKFKFMPWFDARRKDLIPVTVLVVLAPYLGIPILDQFLKFIKPK